MSGLDHDIEYKSTIIEDIRFRVGKHVNHIGDYLVKLGDRIAGDTPMGLAETYELGHAMGRRKPMEEPDAGFHAGYRAGARNA